MLRLLITYGHEEQVFPVPFADFELGRAPENDIVLQAPGVSRHHARLRRAPGGLEVVDLKSRNGIILEGQRVTHAILTPGCFLQIGTAFLEVEEVSTSEAALARLYGKGGRRLLSTATLNLGGGDPQRRSPADEALALAYYVVQVGAGVPGKRADLLARIKAAIGAEAFGTFEKRRERLHALESAGEFRREDAKLLTTLAAEITPPAPEQVVLVRGGRLLLAGRDTWILGARFSEESLASQAWRKDLLRFLAHEFFLPVRSLEDVNLSEVSRVLQLMRGNIKRTAELLGVSRGTLYKLLKRHSTPKW